MGAQESNLSQKKSHFTFIWTIENASVLLVNECVESPSFITHDKTKWKLMVTKFFYTNVMSLGIQRLECNGPESVEMEYELSVLAEDGSPLRLQTTKKEFKNNDENYLLLFQNYNEVFSQRRAEFLPNDTLTVRCRMWRTGNEISHANTCFARTCFGVDRRSFIWVIREFSSLQPGQKTTPFPIPASRNSLQVILTLLISETNGKNYVDIQISHNSATKDHMMICKFSLLDSNDKVVHSKKIISFILINIPVTPVCYEFFERDKLLHEESSLLPNDVLCLRCEIQIGAGSVWDRIENYKYLEDLEWIKTEMPDIHVSQDCESFTDCCPFKKAFRDLYGDESSSYVTLRAGEKSFPAHKTILSVRSPGLKSMFKLDMTKNEGKIVDIPDMSDDTLDRLLLYIYTDSVQDLKWESAMFLYWAANKYKLLDLRNICSNFLKSNFCVSNVCCILLFACTNEDNDLRKAAEIFISENDNEVFTSKDWKKFKNENFILALEITERIIKRINNENEFLRKNICSEINC